MTPGVDTIVSIALAAAAASNLLAWLFSVRRFWRTGWGLMCVGWLISLGVFVLNWRLAGGPPFGNMYHVLILLSLCLLPLFSLLALRPRMHRCVTYFSVVAVFPLVGALFMERNVLWRRMPALQSAWFVPHVTAYMIAYSLAAVAMVITIAGWITLLLNRYGRPTFHSRASYYVLRLGFPFMTFGLLSGALWADEAWGMYWSWDPKETWSLITWMLYTTYFHCRVTPKMRRYADLVQVLAFLALLTTFLLVNLLPALGSALHGYA